MIRIHVHKYHSQSFRRIAGGETEQTGLDGEIAS